MVAPGQRPGACHVRPSLPAPTGVKTTSPEGKSTDFTSDTNCNLLVMLHVKIISPVTLVLFSPAEAKNLVGEGSISLKQEGGEGPHAQGDGAGKCVCGH